MNKLREGKAHEFAYYALRTARELAYDLNRDLIFFCRHARQPISDVEQWAYPAFYSRLRLLGDLLEKEWEAPDE